MTGADDLFAALAATWPPRSQARVGPWVIRDGAGGGSRVSAATAAAPVGRADLTVAVARMAGLGQPGIVQVRPAQADLDALLAQEGWVVADPTLILVADPARVAGFAAHPPAVRAAAGPPGPDLRALWDAGGIGPARLAVMARVTGPGTAILGRVGDEVAGGAFVAAAGGIAMLHAMVVDPAHRRRGLASAMLGAAARWTLDQGADTLALAVTEANAVARAVYGRAGFTAVTGYHYRIAPAGGIA